MISIHYGSFGVNLADQLYLSQDEEFGPRGTQHRPILVDLVPDEIDNLMLRGKSRHLLDHNFFIRENTDYDNTASSAMYINFRQIKDRVIDKIRQQAESLDRVEGAMIYGSMGSGIGLTPSLEILHQFFTKKDLLMFGLMPNEESGDKNGPMNTTNTVWNMTQILDWGDMFIPFTNRMIFESAALNQRTPMPIHSEVAQNYSYQDANAVICDMLNTMLVPRNHSGCQQKLEGPWFDSKTLISNLVPFPKLKHICPYFYTESKKVGQEKSIPNNLFATITGNKTALAFKPIEDFIPVPTKSSAFMTRGLPKESINFDLQMGTQLVRLREGEKESKKEEVFLPEIYRDRPIYKCASEQEPKHHDYSVLELRNIDSSFVRYIKSLRKDYQKLFSKKAFFMNHFGNGIEKNEAYVVRDNLEYLEKEYDEVITQIDDRRDYDY